MGGKRVNRSAGRGGGLLAAVVAVLLVAGGASTYALTRGGDQRSSPQGVGEQAEHAGHTEAAQSGAEGTEVGAEEGAGACVAEVKAAERAMAAARQGIRHLKMHIGAHQDWVAGRIDEDEKKATYIKSKLAGPGDLAKWDKAIKAYDAKAGGCKDETGDCATRMAVLDKTLDASRMGMHHWDEHLANMASFAAGKFDALEAQGRWDATIAAMPGMVKPYDDALAELKDAPACA